MKIFIKTKIESRRIILAIFIFINAIGLSLFASDDPNLVMPSSPADSTQAGALAIGAAPPGTQAKSCPSCMTAGHAMLSNSEGVLNAVGSTSSDSAGSSQGTGQ